VDPQNVKGRKRHVESGALFAGFQVAVEYPLDGAQALVDGLPRQTARAGGDRLVAGRVQVVAQGGQEVGAVAGVMVDEAAELSFGVVLDADRS
jgi:hypothetical protein